MTTKKERREKKLKTRENKREKKRENERENEEKKSRLEKSRPKKSDLYRPAPPSFADVLFYWDLDDEDEEGNELLAVTLKPLTVAARMFILDRQPIAGLHPDDPGNLLDNPDIAGPAVGQWVRELYRYHTGKELVPRGRGPDRVPEAGPRAESVRRRLLAPLEKLKALLESKGDSDRQPPQES